VAAHAHVADQRGSVRYLGLGRHSPIFAWEFFSGQWAEPTRGDDPFLCSGQIGDARVTKCAESYSSCSSACPRSGSSSPIFSPLRPQTTSAIFRDSDGNSMTFGPALMVPRNSSHRRRPGLDWTHEETSYASRSQELASEGVELPAGRGAERVVRSRSQFLCKEADPLTISG